MDQAAIKSMQPTRVYPSELALLLLGAVFAVALTAAKTEYGLLIAGAATAGFLLHWWRQLLPVLVVVAAAGVVLAVSIFFLVSKVGPNGSVAVPPARYDVPLTVNARLSPPEESWLVDETMTVTKNVENPPPSWNGSEWARVIADLPRQLSSDGWTLDGFDNGSPTYRRKVAQQAEVVTSSFLSRTYSFNVSAVEYQGEGLRLVGDSSSHLNVTTPRGSVASTDPPVDVKPVPGGDRFVVGGMPDQVVLALMRPIFCNSVLRGLTSVPDLSGSGWAVSGVSLIGGWYGKDILKSLAAKAFGKFRLRSQPTNSPDPDAGDRSEGPESVTRGQQLPPLNPDPPNELL